MGNTENFGSLFSQLTEEQIFYLTLYSFIFSAIITLGMFILKAIAVCKMAKKRGFSNWWLGLIPYANFYMLGKLAGPVRLFGLDLKNVGLFVLISAAILDCVKILTVLAGFGIFSTLLYYITAIYRVSSLIEIIYYISTIALSLAIFGKYDPPKRILYTILSLIQPLFPILLIVIMNKKPYNNFDEYYKEEMAKKYGQTYNPYENPYSTKENPFNNSYNNGNSRKDDVLEDPFDEFKGD